MTVSCTSTSGTWLLCTMAISFLCSLFRPRCKRYFSPLVSVSLSLSPLCSVYSPLPWSRFLCLLRTPGRVSLHTHYQLPFIQTALQSTDMLTLRLALTFALASTAFSFPNAGAGADQHRLSRVVRRHHLRRSQAQSQDGGPDGGAGGAGGTGQTQSGGSGGSPGGSDGGDSGGDGSGGALSSLIPTGLSPTNTDGGAGDPTTTPTSDPDPTSGSDPDPKSSPTAEPKAKPKPTDGGDGGSPTSSGGDPTPTGGPGGDTGDGGATVGSDGVATLTKPVGDGVSDPTGYSIPSALEKHTS